MATEYKLEITFPEDGTKTGHYKGRETAIDRANYWLESGASEVKVINLMTNGVAFHRKARAYAPCL